MVTERLIIKGDDGNSPCNSMRLMDSRLLEIGARDPYEVERMRMSAYHPPGDGTIRPVCWAFRAKRASVGAYRGTRLLSHRTTRVLHNLAAIHSRGVGACERARVIAPRAIRWRMSER